MPYASLISVIWVVCIICGSRASFAAQRPHHDGIKLEGFATAVTPNSITVFDKKNRETEILTDKDYTSLVGIAVPVTVWYTTENGMNRLEDIVYSRKSATFVPVDSILNNIKRIIILPRSEGVDNSAGLISAISSYLADHAGLFIAPPELAAEIASRSNDPSSSSEAIDPYGSDVDMERYLDAQRALMTEIADETRSDAVLEVRVIRVKAKVRGSIATWDDMKEPVASRTARTLSPFTILGGTGWVYAATADMSLWSRNGQALWKERRGFAVLGMQMAIGSRYRERPLTEVYQDHDVMQRWLSDTLGELAPSIKVAPAPSLQPSSEIQNRLDKTN